MPDLPIPDEVERAHCERVVARVRREIEEAGGFLPFARYMELALHEPGLGYYAAGAEKLGARGDFTTAPEMSPLFGAALATQVAAILERSARRNVLELGAGTGRLAVSLLDALARAGALPDRYLILERSADLRARQRERVAYEAPAHLERCEWLDELPGTVDGAIVANEVLDALAVHVVQRAGGVYRERGVGMHASLHDRDVGGVERDASASLDRPPHFGLGWSEQPAPAWLARVAALRFPEDVDYTSEINVAAEALVETLGGRLASGAMLLIDYGFPAREYYHPQRTSGTLMCHYRHRAHGDPLFYPGLCDITAHVDWSAMAAAGQRAGLHLRGFCAQAPFLLGCGILERLAETGAPETLPYMKAASQVQTLLSPAEMGELFKVLALSRSDGIDWRGFSVVDHRHRL